MHSMYYYLGCGHSRFAIFDLDAVLFRVLAEAGLVAESGGAVVCVVHPLDLRHRFSVALEIEIRSWRSPCHYLWNLATT